MESELLVGDPWSKCCHCSFLNISVQISKWLCLTWTSRSLTETYLLFVYDHLAGFSFEYSISVWLYNSNVTFLIKKLIGYTVGLKKNDKNWKMNYLPMSNSDFYCKAKCKYCVLSYVLINHYISVVAAFVMNSFLLNLLQVYFYIEILDKHNVDLFFIKLLTWCQCNLFYFFLFLFFVRNTIAPFSLVWNG